MLKNVTLSALVLFPTIFATATTTAVNFDNPACPNLKVH
jgi:hypothetical protein